MCKVYGCTTAGCQVHVCRFCKTVDSHRTSFCPIRFPRSQCCASGCNLCGPHNNYIHVCICCGLSDSQHRAKSCPGKQQVTQTGAFGKPFFQVPAGLPNPGQPVHHRHHARHMQPAFVQMLPQFPQQGFIAPVPANNVVGVMLSNGHFVVLQ